MEIQSSHQIWQRVNFFCTKPLTPLVRRILLDTDGICGYFFGHIGGSNSSPKLRCHSDVDSPAFRQPTWAQ